jgi:hypothetical protein
MTPENQEIQSKYDNDEVKLIYDKMHNESYLAFEMSIIYVTKYYNCEHMMCYILVQQQLVKNEVMAMWRVLETDDEAIKEISSIVGDFMAKRFHIIFNSMVKKFRVA